jgi:NADPH:quinone reductase-like Zn-dependent oxidoreductase
MPQGMSFEEATTLGTAITSVGLALYKSMGLPLPLPRPCREPEPRPQHVEGRNPWILIYGGDCPTGTLAIQFAKLYAVHLSPEKTPFFFCPFSSGRNKRKKDKQETCGLKKLN